MEISRNSNGDGKSGGTVVQHKFVENAGKYNQFDYVHEKILFENNDTRKKAIKIHGQLIEVPFNNSNKDSTHK